MAAKTVSITAEGRKDLEKELAELKARRPEIAEKIATARSYGDLSENEDYSAARGEQKVIEGRILEIEDILLHAKIIKSGKKEKVAMGSTVTLESSGKTNTYTLVGAVEANPLEGKISNESPIGKAIFGKKVGEEVKLPNGKTFKVSAIE
jgi:transcription elongation factor GreA